MGTSKHFPPLQTGWSRCSFCCVTHEFSSAEQHSVSREYHMHRPLTYSFSTITQLKLHVSREVYPPKAFELCFHPRFIYLVGLIELKQKKSEPIQLGFL